MSRVRRFFLYLAAFLALPVVAVGGGFHELRARERPAITATEPGDAPRPSLDPRKRTVVVVLGADLTEITDAVGPYEIFARAGAFNVITASVSRAPTLLTGGLRIVPHYSLDELDSLLGARGPDVVVVPNIPNVTSPVNAPIVSWLQKRSATGALIHSWCKGAKALAQAGLLDGRTATAHWGDLPQLEKEYPAVHWIRGVRWIDHGQLIMSAGITSGIDASLHALVRLVGEAHARRVAREIRYPNFGFALDPAAPQLVLGPADAILVANAGLRTGRSRIGVGLYDGVGELDLSNLYDAHGHTAVADVASVAESSRVVVTAHGLTLLPALSVADGAERVRGLDRLIVPGPDAPTIAIKLAAAVVRLGGAPRPEFVHAREPHRFGLEPVLEDLARTADVPTARFAQRRLEYRSDDVALVGSRVPWRVVLTAVGLGLVGITLAHGALRRRATR